MIDPMASERSSTGLIAALDDLIAHQIDLSFNRQSTPSAKAMFQMTGVFAEFERAMISERVRIGIGRAKLEGSN
ncbi:recombinase family protein [Mesorhizobium sp. M0700]|uniref:recombinase family protein n=1 Tax=Mesorhizobium sp. M0700 TaxID=2956988 RepID=UPI0033355110